VGTGFPIRIMRKEKAKNPVRGGAADGEVEIERRRK
jgi:hypothetical protein